MKINPEVYILFSTYEDYKSMPGSLTPEEMAGLHKQILDDAKLDADSADLFKNVFAAAVKYSQSRAGWPLWDREKRMGEDSARTSRHNQVIDSLNILARYLKAQGKAAMWRDVLGEDRKRIGDFACYLVFVGSLKVILSSARRELRKRVKNYTGKFTVVCTSAVFMRLLGNPTTVTTLLR